jgi:hypothetical protein
MDSDGTSINYSIIKLIRKWLRKSRKKILWKTLFRSIIKPFCFGKNFLKINSNFINLILQAIKLEDYECRAEILSNS